MQLTDFHEARVPNFTKIRPKNLAVDTRSKADGRTDEQICSPHQESLCYFAKKKPKNALNLVSIRQEMWKRLEIH
jgi:hypothetical protein